MNLILSYERPLRENAIPQSFCGNPISATDRVASRERHMLLSMSLVAAAAFSTPRLSVLDSHGRHRHTRTPTSTPSLLCDGTFGLIATQGDYLDSMNGLFADPVTRNFGVVSAFAAAKVYGEVTNLNRVNASGWAVWLGIAYGFTGAFTYRQVLLEGSKHQTSRARRMAAPR